MVTRAAGASWLTNEQQVTPDSRPRPNWPYADPLQEDFAMKITEMALRASRLTYLAAVIILVAGIAPRLSQISLRRKSHRSRDF